MNTQLSTSQQCKKAGLKSLAELAQITGRSTRTLQHWAVYEPRFFAVVLTGAVACRVT